MSPGDIIIFIQEFAYLLGVFGVFLLYSIVRGRQHLINLIVSLYFALLISLEFPYYNAIFGASGGESPITRIIIFIIFTIISVLLITRLMPREYQEKKFESLGKKLLLSVAGTVLLMAYSFHVLPMTEFVTPGTPIQSLFAPAEYFFWWLFTPLIVLYLN